MRNNKEVKEITPCDFCIDDTPTRTNSPWVTMAVNFLTVLILGSSFNTSYSALFSSTAIFAVPLLLEYLNYRPKKKMRRTIRTVNIIMVGAIVFVCILNFVGILVIRVPEGNSVQYILVEENYAVLSGRGVPAISLWWLSVCCFFGSVVNHFVTMTPIEKDINDYSQTAIGA